MGVRRARRARRNTLSLGPEPPDEHRANYLHEGSPQAPTPVGMYPEGATPSGIQDLAGNVWEWTATWYEKDKYRIVRGGGWSGDPQVLRVSVRLRGRPEDRGVILGFRCVRDEPVPAIPGK
jgi:formylglycine-generating enzyme required for sulfatase activity